MWVLCCKRQKPTLVSLTGRDFIGGILGILRNGKETEELGSGSAGNKAPVEVQEPSIAVGIRGGFCRAGAR